MAEPASNPVRGRGRGKSRGGLGKYLRARGRGGGRGRPAEFSTRLVLEGERKPELTEEEEAELAREIRERYSRRRLGTNEDRYKEEEVELDSDGECDQSVHVDYINLFCLGEPIVEPEVDLSNFLERQRLADDTELTPIPGTSKDDKDDEDVDTTLAHISSYPSRLNPSSKKGKVEQIVWDEELDQMNRDKKAAEATWGKIIFISIFFLIFYNQALPLSDLKMRFRAKSEKIRASPATHISPTSSRSRKPGTLSTAPSIFIPDCFDLLMILI